MRYQCIEASCRRRTQVRSLSYHQSGEQKLRLKNLETNSELVPVRKYHPQICTTAKSERNGGRISRTIAWALISSKPVVSVNLIIFSVRFRNFVCLLLNSLDLNWFLLLFWTFIHDFCLFASVSDRINLF